MPRLQEVWVVGRRRRAPAPIGGRGQGHRVRAQHRRNKNAIPFLAPALVILSVFVAWPMISAFMTSLTDSSGFGTSNFIGLDNYARAFSDPNIWRTLTNTVQYVVLFTPTAVGLALLLALLLNTPSLPFSGMLRSALFLPFIVSLSVAAFAWTYLLDPNVGLVNYWLSNVGIRLGNVLQDPNLALPTVALVAVWKNFGFYMVVFLAGLQDIPSQLYEAARVDGAGPFRRFVSVTLPSLSNTFGFVMIFAMIAALQAFDQIYVMTGGGPYGHTQTIVMEIYRSGFRNLELGFASALSYILLAITLALSLLQILFFGRRERDLE